MVRITKTPKDAIQRVERGWGYELWIENMKEYCGKALVLSKGKRSSFHYHMKKMETMYLVEGRVILRMMDTDTGKEYEIELLQGDKIRLERGKPHQIIAMEDSVLFEFSTFHEEEDSYRIQKGD